jgi:hypothetical protein
MPQGRDQVDQVSGGDDYPCLLLLGEVVDVLLEGLEVGGVGCSEPPREDVVISAEGLTDIPSVGHVQNCLQLDWLLVDAMKVDLLVLHIFLFALTGMAAIQYFLSEDGLKMRIDGFEQIVLNGGLIVFEFVQHVKPDFIICSLVRVNRAQGYAVGDGHRFGERQMPLQSAIIGQKCLFVGDNIRRD